MFHDKTWFWPWPPVEKWFLRTCRLLRVRRNQGQAFITTRLHSCNALYNGITDDLISSPPADPERCRSVADGHSELDMDWIGLGKQKLDLCPTMWAFGDATAFRQFYASCTGFQCGSALRSRSPPSFTRRCLDMIPATWLTNAASSF